MRQPALSVVARDADATAAIGAALAATLPPGASGLLVTLAGELGAGKTTLARAMLRQWGARGTVRSPTYTLVEPYELDCGTVLHFDLYRLVDPGELDALGYRELRATCALALLEWPERCAGRLGTADLACEMTWHGDGRQLGCSADSAIGRAWLEAFRRAAASARQFSLVTKED